MPTLGDVERVVPSAVGRPDEYFRPRPGENDFTTNVRGACGAVGGYLASGNAKRGRVPQ
jgi:hypothetical protein